MKQIHVFVIIMVIWGISLTATAGQSVLPSAVTDNVIPVVGNQVTSSVVSVSPPHSGLLGSGDLSISQQSGLPGTGAANPSSGTAVQGQTISGVYTIDGKRVSVANKRIISTNGDVSSVLVKNGGKLTLTSPVIIKSGDTSSNDESSFYGLNAAVLANSASTVIISRGVITSSGTGANGAFASGTSSYAKLTNVTIRATGNGGHGVMATQGGTMVLNNVTISTSGKNAAPIATDRGSGTITVSGGTFTDTGQDSPGIYSTGKITVTGSTIKSTGSEAAVIEGSNSITLNSVKLTGGVQKTGGVMIYQSFSGDASTGLGTFTMKSGTFTVPLGPAFYVTNTEGKIILTGITIKPSSGVLLKAAAGQWGTSGNNGGTVTMNANKVTLKGSIISDSISSVSVILKNKSTLSGAINSASLTLDKGSSWNVTGTSALSVLSDSGAISGTKITNIRGNGYMVTYDKNKAGNNALGGKTYTLVNGGKLIPK